MPLSIWLLIAVAMFFVAIDREKTLHADDVASQATASDSDGDRNNTSNNQQASDAVEIEILSDADDISKNLGDMANVFEATHAGWSVDEVLLDDARRKKFLIAAREAFPHKDDRALLESIVRLRKAGKLTVKTTRRQPSLDDESIVPIAEVAARRMQDEYDASFDQVLVDPVKLAAFDRFVAEIDEGIDTYDVRKAALRLRKSRALRPELVLRVNDWKRIIETRTLEETRASLATLSTRPGVYIFRDSSGYLYIGQSNNLRERMSKHLDLSDRKRLAKYIDEAATGEITIELHIFEDGSPAEKTIVREAYESELIRSRKPRLNLAP